jgi:hypothetical protein
MPGQIQLNEDAKPVHREAYEWKSDTVTVAGATPTQDITSIDGGTAFDDLFSDVGIAHQITISASGTAYFRLNSTDNDIITVTATTPYTNNYAVVRKLYVATGGAGIAVTVKIE